MGFTDRQGKGRIYSEIFVILLFLIFFCSYSIPFVNAQGNETGNYTGNETNASNISLPYVDPVILESFEQNQTWVDVVVAITDISNISVQGTKEERADLLNQREEILNRALDIILANYSQEELQTHYILSGTFSGSVTKQGLDKLSNDQRIKEINLEYKGIGSGATGKNKTIETNETESNKPTIPEDKEKIQSTDHKKNPLGRYFIAILLLLIVGLFLNNKFKKKK